MFDDKLNPETWVEFSGAEQPLEQARRQFKAARGIPIRWHVAEKKAADAIRKLLNDRNVEVIEVVHTHALQ